METAGCYADFNHPYLRTGVAGGVAGHPEALPQAHSQPPGLQLHQRGDAHQAVEGNLHQAEVGEARRLGADQPTLGGAEQSLPRLVDPAPQPVEGAVAAPRVVYSRGEDRGLGLPPEILISLFHG